MAEENIQAPAMDAKVLEMLTALQEQVAKLTQEKSKQVEEKKDETKGIVAPTTVKEETDALFVKDSIGFYHKDLGAKYKNYAHTGNTMQARIRGEY